MFALYGWHKGSAAITMVGEHMCCITRSNSVCIGARPPVFIIGSGAGRAFADA